MHAPARVCAVAGYPLTSVLRIHGCLRSPAAVGLLAGSRVSICEMRSLAVALTF